MTNLRYFRAFWLLLLSLTVRGQAVELIPANPSLDDSVKVILYADRGNKALQDFDGEVYMFSGVLTAGSKDSGDWKHPIGKKDAPDEKLQMKALAKDIYAFQMRNIRDFYHIPGGEKVQQLVFAFHNRDGSIIAKKKNREYFTVPVNDYFPELKKLDTASYFQRQFISYQYQWGKLTIETNHGKLLLQAYTNDIIKISNRLTPVHTDSSNAVILPASNIQMKIEESEQRITVEAGNFQIEIEKFPVRLRFSYRNHLILEEEKGYYKEKEKSGLYFAIQQNEKFWGLGERAIPGALNGERYELYNNAPGRYETGAKNLDYSVPLLLSSQKYMLFFDNPSKGTVDIGHTNAHVLQWEGLGANNTYFLTGGKNYRDILKAYFKLTGRQKIPPRWAFGNILYGMSSGAGEIPAREVENIQNARFPADALILNLRAAGTSAGKQSSRRTIEHLKQKGIKTIGLTSPYLPDTSKDFSLLDRQGLFAKDKIGKTYILSDTSSLGHCALIDIFKPGAQSWVWKDYQQQISLGQDALCEDAGEPEIHPPDMYHVAGKADEIHNLYAHYREKLWYEGYRKEYPGKRLFTLNSAGYAGSQRYSVFPWARDVRRTWSGLQAQIPVMLHASVSGLPYIHTVAGGIKPQEKDAELFIRWLQLAAFTPVLRTSETDLSSVARLFPDSTQKIIRQVINERYRLLPYFYTLAWKQATLGELLIKPLFFNYPKESPAYNFKDTYLLGDRLLIHPVLYAHKEWSNIYLPKGLWYDYYSGEAYTGENIIRYRNSIQHIPVFVRAGSFIAKVRPVLSMDQYRTDTLWISYYPTHREGTYNSRIYEDDGHTRNAWKKQKFEIMSFFAGENDKELNIRFQKQFFEYDGRIAKRRIILRILSPGFRIKKVEINGKKILPEAKAKGDAYYVSGEDDILLYFPWGDKDLTIDLKSH